MRKNWQLFLNFIGVETTLVTHKERILSGLGVFAGILGTYLASSAILGTAGTAWMVSSMGASAILLFGVPHGALSQPWPLVCGHLLSALVGVACSRAVSNPMLAAPLAVGLAMVAMHYTRSIHPPGGATALTAVIGGSEIHSLGFGYILAPVLTNVLVILIIAFLFNAFFSWRRYPACMAARKQESDPIPRESLAFALRQMDSFIDVSEEDLEEIYATALKHAKGASPRRANPEHANASHR